MSFFLKFTLMYFVPNSVISLHGIYHYLFTSVTIQKTRNYLRAIEPMMNVSKSYHSARRDDSQTKNSWTLTTRDESPSVLGV